MMMIPTVEEELKAEILDLKVQLDYFYSLVGQTITFEGGLHYLISAWDFDDMLAEYKEVVTGEVPSSNEKLRYALNGPIREIAIEGAGRLGDMLTVEIDKALKGE